MSVVVLVEAAPWSAADGSPVAVRLAGGGERAYTHRGFTDWRAGVMGMPRFAAQLGFGQDGWTGGAIPTTGAVTFAPSDPSLLDQLASRMWAGAPIEIRTGDDASGEPAWSVELKGVVAGATVRGGVLSLTVSDLSGDLAKSAIEARFAGTGGVEGIAEAKDRIKRRSWGRCWGIEGRLLDKANNIYEFGDPAFPWQAFDAVKDRGRAGPTTIVAWAGSIAATFAALQAVTAPQGGAAVAPSIACVKWWTVPAGPLTADVRGEIGAGYVETAPEIAARIVGARSTLAVSNAVAMALARPGAAGIHVDSEGETAAQLLDRLLFRVSLVWIVDPDGSVRLSPIGYDAPVEELTATEVEREAAYKPVTEVVLGYQRNHRRHTDAEISAVFQASDGTYADGTPIEDLKPAAPGATPGAPGGTIIGGTLDPHTGVVVGGRPAEQVIDQIDLIGETTALTAAELVELGATVEAAEAEIAGALNSIDSLDRARIAGEAAARQLDRQVAEGADALLRTVLEGWKTRRRMRDAGITVDPVTGIVSIRAVEDTSERLSEAEIRLNAAENSILLRATTTYVDDQIAQAVIDPSQLPELGGLQIRMGAAELALDGLEASILLKASAASLDALQLSVTDLGTQYDALEGTITTKADSSVVDALGARVGAVETVISTLGNVSSITTTIRQARLIAQDTAEATLKGLLAQHAAGKLRRQQIAEVRSEAYAKIDEGLAAEASRRETLAAEVGAATAAIADVDTARVEGDHANATAIDTVAATLAGLESEVAAEVARLDLADVTEAEARAASILAVEASLGDLSATVTDLVEVVVTAEGASAKALSEMDVNGRVLGFYRTNDGTRTATVFRTDKFGLVDPDTDEQYFGVDDAGAYFRNINIQMFGPGGTAMKVTGVGFGSANQFLEWFGPAMPLDECTEANGTYWLKLDGTGYFGGGLSASTLKNENSSTQTGLDAAVTTGQFGSNGGPRSVLLTYQFASNKQITGACPAIPTLNASVELYRGTDATGVLLTTLNIASGEWSCVPGAGEFEPGGWTVSMGGGLTYTDNSGGLSAAYYARLTSRTAPTGDVITQKISLVSIEE